MNYSIFWIRGETALYAMRTITPEDMENIASIEKHIFDDKGERIEIIQYNKED